MNAAQPLAADLSWISSRGGCDFLQKGNVHATARCVTRSAGQAASNLCLCPCPAACAVSAVQCSQLQCTGQNASTRKRTRPSNARVSHSPPSCPLLQQAQRRACMAFPAVCVPWLKDFNCSCVLIAWMPGRAQRSACLRSTQA